MKDLVFVSFMVVAFVVFGGWLINSVVEEQAERERHRLCNFPQADVLSLIDTENGAAIEHILNECPYRMFRYRNSDLHNMPLLHALTKGKIGIAKIIANHSNPLWTSRDGFGVDVIAIAHGKKEFELLSMIYKHESCKNDEHTYCNPIAAKHLQDNRVHEFVRVQVSNHLAQVENARRKEINRLENGTPEERESIRGICRERNGPCDRFCDPPGTCPLTTISFDLEEHHKLGHLCSNPWGRCCVYDPNDPGVCPKC